jgi:hypothetical protein
MIDSILSIINKFIPDQEEARKLATDLDREFTKRMAMRSEIIQAEERNGSGRWRVRLMYLCMVLVGLHFFMYELIPYIRTVFDLSFYTPEAPDSAELWSFLKIGVGGYLGSRGIEKSIAHFRSK